MLGRKTYDPAEIDRAEAAITAQLEAFTALKGTGAFEPLFCDALLLALDRPFVHRVRPVVGKDPNPLNEVELLTESLLAGDGVLHTNKVIKWVPERTVLGLADGDPITLTADDFDRLATAFFAELRARFLP
jgi:hypothetical protein